MPNHTDNLALAPFHTSTPPEPGSAGDGKNKELSLVALPTPSSLGLEKKERKKRKAMNDIEQLRRVLEPFKPSGPGDRAEKEVLPPPSSSSLAEKKNKKKKRKAVDDPEKVSEAVVPIQHPRPLDRKAQKAEDHRFKRLEQFRAMKQLILTMPRDLIQDKVGEKKTNLARIDRSLQNKTLPISKVWRMRLEKEKAGEERAIDALETLSRDELTNEQLAFIEDARIGAPNYLGRTASMARGFKFGHYHNKTNGLTTHDVLLPSADTKEGYISHSQMTDLSQGSLRYMIGEHLKWTDRAADEFLSYSKDSLFLLVHALSRYHQRQGDVTIQVLDLRKANAADGSKASFYDALDLYTALDVPNWKGWDDWSKTKLHPRKFTHEYLTHGPIRYTDPALKPARVQDLIEDGLYEIFPDLDAPDNHKRAGLYTLQVVLRKIGYPPPNRDQKRGRELGPIYSYDQCSRVVPMTLKFLQIVRKVTLNFCNIPEGTEVSAFQPPLQIFIWFLTFQKRPRHDPVFETWIKEHYTGADVTDIYTDSAGKILPGFTTVADNLPGCMQNLDLIRDCISIFDLRPLPPNDIKTAHVFDGTKDRPYDYAKYDDCHHRNDVKSELYSAVEHEKSKQRAHKRRAITAGKVDDTGDSEDEDDAPSETRPLLTPAVGQDPDTGENDDEGSESLRKCLIRTAERRGWFSRTDLLRGFVLQTSLLRLAWKYM